MNYDSKMSPGFGRNGQHNVAQRGSKTQTLYRGTVRMQRAEVYESTT